MSFCSAADFEFGFNAYVVYEFSSEGLGGWGWGDSDSLDMALQRDCVTDPSDALFIKTGSQWIISF
jgi:hypothetical protein